MAAINIILKSGPKTFKAVSAVTGGQIVEAGTGGVVPATADSAKVLGVAVTDGGPQTDPVPGVLVPQKKPHVAVAYSGMEVTLETTAQLAFGDKVGAAAGGKAKKWTAGDVVGIVTDPSPSATHAVVRLS